MSTGEHSKPELMSEEHVVCPHCGGAGKVPIPSFMVGARVWWKVGGDYVGYQGRVPCEVTGYSKSKLRVKIRYETMDRNGRLTGRFWTSMVTPKYLEPRE